MTFIFTSCTSVYRATYTTENIKGNAVVDEKNMFVDYGKFEVQYTTKGDVTIINKTDSTMYIDMAESYYVGNGDAQRLYTNSVTTNFSSGSKGATVNLGSVTNALGVGGVVGTLAQGVNVGGSNVNGSSTQVFEERYISIPPLSRKAVKSVSFPNLVSSVTKLKESGVYRYEKNNSFNNEYIFAYTFDANAGTFLSTRDLIRVGKIETTKHINGFKAYKVYKKTANNEEVGEAMDGKDMLKTALITTGATLGAIFGLVGLSLLIFPGL